MFESAEADGEVREVGKVSEWGREEKNVRRINDGKL